MISIILNLVAVAFSTVSITMLIPFLQILFGRAEPLPSPPPFSFSAEFILDTFRYYVGQWTQKEGPLYALTMVSILSIAIFFAKNLFRYLALYVFSYVRTRFLYEMRMRLYSHLLRVPVRSLLRYQRGDIVSRFTADIHEVEWAIVNSLEILFREPVTILMYLGLMLMISPSLTVIVLVVLGLSGAIIGMIGRKLKQESAEAQAYTGKLAGLVEETLRGFVIIRVFRAEAFLRRTFHRLHQMLDRVRLSSLRRRELSSPLSEFLGICAVVLVLWIGGREVLAGTGLQPEAFITFVVVFSQLINPAKSFATAYYHVQRGMASAERIERLLTLPLEEEEENETSEQDIVSDASRRKRHEIRGDTLRLEHVSFAYGDSGKPVLKRVSTQFRKGELVLIVGPSGSGKTTLIQILAAFFRPQEGEI